MENGDTIWAYVFTPNILEDGKKQLYNKLGVFKDPKIAMRCVLLGAYLKTSPKNPKIAGVDLEKKIMRKSQLGEGNDIDGWWVISR